MKDALKTGFSDRLSAAADAKKARLAKFTPKPTIQDPDIERRKAERAAALEAVRAERAAAKEAARLVAKAKIEAMEATKREARKERKAQEKMDSRARRDARFEAYKGLRAPSGSTVD
jgi:hypothetical protein